MKFAISILVGWTYVLIKTAKHSNPAIDSIEQLKMPTKIKRTAFKFAESFLETDSIKMAMIDKELSKVKLTGKIEILPNKTSSVKFYRNLETKEYSWEDHGTQSFICRDCWSKNIQLCEHRNDWTAQKVLRSILDHGAYSDRDRAHTAMLNRDAFVDAVFDYVSDRAFLSNDVSKEFAHLPVEDAVYNSGGIIASRVFEFVPTYRKSPQFKQTPLMLAARYDEQIVSNLIRRHADVNEKDCNQRTALHHALNCGKETSALKLIEAGADVEAKDCNQTVALHIAARQGYGKLVCLMIEKGADVNPKDYQKRTPLHFAAEGGHYGSCRALLLNGAKKNVKDKIRKTPLMYTARCVPADEDHSDELEETVWLLLEHGANTKIKDCDGHTAIFGASEKCITAIEDFEEQKK